MGKWYTKLSDYKGAVQSIDAFRSAQAGGLGIGMYINSGFNKPFSMNIWIDQFSFLRDAAYPLAIALSTFAPLYANSYLDFVDSMT